MTEVENLSNDPEDAKNTDPSAPQQVTPDGNIVPNLSDVPEDDAAEPEDADVDHSATEQEVDEVAEETP